MNQENNFDAHCLVFDPCCRQLIHETNKCKSLQAYESCLDDLRLIIEQMEITILRYKNIKITPYKQAFP